MRTDFQKAFQHGYTFECNMPDYDQETVTISIVDIGNLVLPSGKVVVQDPGNPTSSRYCLQKKVEPGKYPVSLSLACFNSVEECIIACAKIQISEASPTHWQIAVSENLQYPSPTYDVDSGIACFMDFEAALFLKQMAFPYQQTDILHPLNDLHPEFRDDYIREQFIRKMIEKMDENGEAISESIPWQLERYAWANFPLDEIAAFDEISDNDSVRKPDANIIVFGAGWGEGKDYSSYWGISDNNETCCLITDFFIFFEKYQEYSELHEHPDIVFDDDG